MRARRILIIEQLDENGRALVRLMCGHAFTSPRLLVPSYRQANERELPVTCAECYGGTVPEVMGPPTPKAPA